MNNVPAFASAGPCELWRMDMGDEHSTDAQRLAMVELHRHVVAESITVMLADCWPLASPMPRQAHAPYFATYSTKPFKLPPAITCSIFT